MGVLVNLANILGGSDVKNLPQVSSPGTNTINSGLAVVYEIVGALAFLLILIAALRYVLNSSDPNKISEAKRMIAYTLVGVAIVALAGTIVGFVLGA
jgi:hypothetical protein